MSKFVSLSYFDLAELFRKSMFSIHRNKPMNLDISCADPESFFRGGPTLTTFFS